MGRIMVNLLQMWRLSRMVCSGALFFFVFYFCGYNNYYFCRKLNAYVKTKEMFISH